MKITKLRAFNGGCTAMNAITVFCHIHDVVVRLHSMKENYTKSWTLGDKATRAHLGIGLLTTQNAIINGIITHKQNLSLSYNAVSG